MGCTNCFNGCTDIISDGCVKYTGNPFTLLGVTINTGDNLLTVEQSIFNILTQLESGEGVIPTVDYNSFCATLGALLPNGSNSTLNEALEAVATMLCDHETRITDVEADITALNADYNVDCLSGVVASSDTHAVLQAAITKLCQTALDLTALSLDLSTNYVLISEIDTFIQDYLDNQPGSDLISNKMVPYVAVAYFGPTLGNFDITGAGLGDWDKIYLCNGQNFTPDLRGRTIVGTTTMGANAFNPAVDPGIAGNPTYTLNSTLGANTVALTPNQLAPHTHTITINPTTTLEGEIRHVSQSFNDFGEATGVFTKTSGWLDDETPSDTDYQDTGGFILDVNHTHTATASTVGTGEAHSNIQPVIAANYIMYIP